ncbi:hypothetical protein ACJRO7_033553 [Eucalyptus globulus]|uniref:Uncharacterized protein n=1 Tax=Eucalyptus globulus TaxID=34317 RepID=A0ABD3JRW4_EUCGL
MDQAEALTELLVDGTSITNIPEMERNEEIEIENSSAIACRSLSACTFAGCLTSLLTLRLDYIRIAELPFANFGSLVELNLSNSSTQELLDSMGKMKNLRVLRMHCTHLRKPPSALEMLEKLEEIEEINAGNSRNLEEISSVIGRLPFLRILRLSNTIIFEVTKLPESLTNLYIITCSKPPLNRRVEKARVLDVVLS